MLEGGGNAVCDVGHTFVVQRVRGVGGLMIVRVSEKAGIRQHQCRVTLIPKRAIVTESNLLDLFGKANRKQWHRSCATFESAAKLPAKLAR